MMTARLCGPHTVALLLVVLAALLFYLHSFSKCLAPGVKDHVILQVNQDETENLKEKQRDEINQLKRENSRLLHDLAQHQEEKGQDTSKKTLDQDLLSWKHLLETPGNDTNLMNVSGVSIEQLNRHFKKWSLSKKEKDYLFAAFDLWTKLASDLAIPWFLVGGSLLGSYRHHGLIPWDADIDVVADGRFKQRVFEEFKNRRYTDFQISRWFPWHKIFHVNGTRPPMGGTWKNSLWKWRVPFLDVFYWEMNDTHVSEPLFKFHALKSDIFPLTERPFQGRMVPAPRDPRKALEAVFQLDKSFPLDHECFSGDYDYLKERRKPENESVTLPCVQLLNYYPFVQQTRGAGGGYCKEELVLRGNVLNTFYRTAENIPVC